MDSLSSHSSLGLPADHGKNFQKIKQFWVDLENQFSISSRASSQASNSIHQELLEKANVSPIPSPQETGKQIIASKKIDWKAVSIRALSFFAAGALGALTGLALAGTMVTPVGWAIAGGVLAIALIGAAVYGGPKEFWQALQYSVLGFATGVGLGSLIGVQLAQAAAAAVGAASSPAELGLSTVVEFGVLEFSLGFAGTCLKILKDMG